MELTRRAFLGRSAGGLGAMALSRLLGGDESVVPHFAPKAKRVVYLFQSGGPSHIDLFDYKPVMRELHGQELPASVRGGQRVTGMTAGQASFPVLAPPFEFKQPMTGAGRRRCLRVVTVAAETELRVCRTT